MVACALGALALLVAGCGAEERTNNPRLQAPTRVSVAVAEDSITVQPPRIAIGPEPTQRLPQNQHASQPQVRSKAPLTIVLTAANLTDFDSRLELKGPKDVTSGPLVANGNANLLVDLPTGVYEVTAADIPGAKAAKLVVGPYRVSSENELLLP
jgi:hypothetical protein